jgi:hypothetical protein
MHVQDDPEESSSGTSAKQVRFANSRYIDDDGEEFPEGDIPSSPDTSKKTRPTRACDFCRRKKVCSTTI